MPGLDWTRLEWTEYVIWHSIGRGVNWWYNTLAFVYIGKEKILSNIVLILLELFL